MPYKLNNLLKTVIDWFFHERFFEIINKKLYKTENINDYQTNIKETNNSINVVFGNKNINSVSKGRFRLEALSNLHTGTGLEDILEITVSFKSTLALLHWHWVARQAVKGLRGGSYNFIIFFISALVGTRGLDKTPRLNVLLNKLD